MASTTFIAELTSSLPYGYGTGYVVLCLAAFCFVISIVYTLVIGTGDSKEKSKKT
jgi:hypothetical protein